MKIVAIFGTRPEGIKMAPIIKVLSNETDLNCVCLNTAQHRGMLDQVLEIFSIVPEYDLDIMSQDQKLQDITTKMITRISAILADEKPQLVLVLGDTATTFAGAYAAFLQQIPVGHVEAGLRTNQMYSPFPEEMYRQLVSRMATYHFAPTQDNRLNLLKENILDNQIKVVGNTVIDALLDVTSKPVPQLVSKLLKKDKKNIIVTTHRRENFNELKNVYFAINEILQNHKDVHVIFPVHKNPNVRKQIDSYLKPHERLSVVTSIDYEVFAHLLKKAFLVITDSGGIQEEAVSLKVPVLVARVSTERPEGVKAGILKLVGLSKESIYNEVSRLILNPSEHKIIANIPNPYGDGTAAKKIVEFIKNEVGSWES
ncbi:UDP-N-acetylglucosamine 2-epimerase (non-hydrolyzing) [Peribacillus frigoritolerans]|uniref:non-hydrolyzing UDP-N-acetylglucosamine 2-epimerase n=1 Tax=Peribacillus frigoritolerans TaxID=450367 RepID=UPI00399FE74C